MYMYTYLGADGGNTPAILNENGCPFMPQFMLTSASHKGALTGRLPHRPWQMSVLQQQQTKAICYIIISINLQLNY